MDFPQIIPIKQENDGVAKYHHPHLPEVGVGVKGGGKCLLMIAPRQCGKSTIISNLFLNDNLFGQDFFDEVVVISPTINMDSTSRFMKKRFTCYDTYSPSIIQGITERQMAFDDEQRPDIAVVLDDCVGLLDRHVANLVTRSRHYNIKLLIISVQKFRGAVDPIIRANATDVIVGSPFPNMKELTAIAEEYGDLFNSPKNWLKLYRETTPKKYDFCYMKLQNPPLLYKNFEKIMATGGQNYDPTANDEDKKIENTD